MSATVSSRGSLWRENSLPGRLWRTNPALILLGIASLITLAAALILLLLDPRVITGAPAWAKPAKFGLSIAFYSFTLVWMLGYVSGHPRLVRWVGNLTALALAVELALIVLQVVRGVRSHFNYSTPFDTTVFMSMAFFIVLTWVMGLVAAVLLLRQRLLDPVLAWSLRLGLLVALVGAGLAFLMTGHPTPAQLALIKAGQPSPEIGAHSVGVEDGGPGLPFLGWSTTGGDLRIPHFLGLHALQAIPLAGFAVTRLFRRRRVALVWTVGIAYLGFVLLLTWQALRGQSIVAPDALTLTVFGAWALAAGAVFAAFSALPLKKT
jgi:hypothetical protein